MQLSFQRSEYTNWNRCYRRLRNLIYDDFSISLSMHQENSRPRKNLALLINYLRSQIEGGQ